MFFPSKKSILPLVLAFSLMLTLFSVSAFGDMISPVSDKAAVNKDVVFPFISNDAFSIDGDIITGKKIAIDETLTVENMLMEIHHPETTIAGIYSAKRIPLKWKDLVSERKCKAPTDLVENGDLLILFDKNQELYNYFVITKDGKTIMNLTLTPPTKVKYKVGEKFQSGGMKVLANKGDGTSVDVTKYAVISGFSSSKAGKIKIAVTYENQSTYFTVTIVKKK